MTSINIVPKRTILEEIGNAITHGVGSIFSIVSLILMIVFSNTILECIAGIIYFIGMFILFTMSCLYHAFKHGSKVKSLFRRFDYLSIYLLIGATYAPILLCYFNNDIGLIFFIIQWIIIITGITFVSIFGPEKLKALHFTLYIILGWSGICIFPNMIQKDFMFFFYILLGGIVYSLGIIPFTMKCKVSHFIWHFFVLFGAIIQWVGIFSQIYLN